MVDEWAELPRSLVRFRTVREPAEAAQAIIGLAAEVESLRQQLQGAVAALRMIAARPTVERNPDGVDQAAWSMQLIAKEALHGPQ